MAVTQIPTPAHPFVDHQARITVPWYLFLQAIYRTVGQGGFAPGDGTYITITPDSDLPNARVATDSDTITVDLTVPGIIRWHTTAAAISDLGYWTPITNGDPLSPEILFDAEGDCVVGFVPTPGVP